MRLRVPLRQTFSGTGPDVGLLIGRVVIGSLFAAHGTQKLFGWFGADHRKPEEQEFAELGYEPAKAFVRLAGGSEITAGLLLIAGLATPLAGAMTGAVSVQATAAAKWDNGPWQQDDGYEYLLVLATAGVMFAFAGPGRLSVDRALHLDLSGDAAGFLALGTAMLSANLPRTLPRLNHTRRGLRRTAAPRVPPA